MLSICQQGLLTRRLRLGTTVMNTGEPESLEREVMSLLSANGHSNSSGQSRLIMSPAAHIVDGGSGGSRNVYIVAMCTSSQLLPGADRYHLAARIARCLSHKLTATDRPNGVADKFSVAK